MRIPELIRLLIVTVIVTVYVFSAVNQSLKKKTTPAKPDRFRAALKAFFKAPKEQLENDLNQAHNCCSCQSFPFLLRGC